MAPKTAEKKPAAAEKKAPALPKHKQPVPGVKHYRLTQPHYRNGKYLERGTYITVKDEPKSNTWVEVKAIPAGKGVRHFRLQKPEPKKKLEVEENLDAPNGDLGEDVQGFEAEGDAERPSDSDPTE